MPDFIEGVSRIETLYFTAEASPNPARQRVSCLRKHVDPVEQSRDRLKLIVLVVLSNRALLYILR